MDTIGSMAMPENFRYREVFLRGRPQHERYDDFSVRHPTMEPGRRAKIFAPFDALKGFGGALAAKNVPYEPQSEPEPEEAAELSRRLAVLKALTRDSRKAKRNRVPVSVTYFVPCMDEDHEACGYLGSYQTVSGICEGVDDAVTKTITVDGVRIALDTVRRIEGSVFERCRGRDETCQLTDGGDSDSQLTVETEE